MAAVGDLEAVGLREQSQLSIARVCDDLLTFVVPDIADAFEEQQREYVGLEVSGIHRAAQDVRRLPKMGFELIEFNATINYCVHI